jgi:release factor glutamine methyltransferase
VIENLSAFISRKARILNQAGIDTAVSEVETILCHLLKTDRLRLYLDGARRLDDAVVARLDEILQRRAARYPLQYLLGEAWFYGRRFSVNPDVMIPRPETEILCREAIEYARERRLSTPRILDLGVGSGVIAVTVAKELDGSRVLAVDISLPALKVAKENARAHSVIDCIEFLSSNFFDAIADTQQFDLILSNPPYVSEKEYDTLPPEVLADPRIALLAGVDGLDAIRVILREAPHYLTHGGRVMLEIGCGQAAAVAKLVETDTRYASFTVKKDLNGMDRIVILSCKE